MQAQAVVFGARNQVVFREIAVPDPGPRDVVVRTRYSWISTGTEGSFLRGERIAGDTPLGPNDPQPFPMVPGYQKTGIIEWVGAEVNDVRPGEWVFASVSRVEGCFYATGGHVSPAVTSREQVWKLPSGLDRVSASGLVLTQVGYNCGTRPLVARGDVAVVLGDGLVGQWAAQTLAWRGARVIMVGHHLRRLAYLCGENSTALLVGSESELAQAVSPLAPQGLAIVVDTVGHVPSVNALLPLFRREGNVVSAGFLGTQGSIDIQRLRVGELTLHSPSGWTRPRMDATLDLLARGALEANALISHTFPVGRAAEAWNLLRTQERDYMGVILEW